MRSIQFRLIKLGILRESSAKIMCSHYYCLFQAQIYEPSVTMDQGGCGESTSHGGERNIRNASKVSSASIRLLHVVMGHPATPIKTIAAEKTSFQEDLRGQL